MGWLQLVGSIKSLVSFAKEPYKRDDILQKRFVNLSILLTGDTPIPSNNLTSQYTTELTMSHAHINRVESMQNFGRYGVASIRGLLKIIGLFCRRALYKRRYFAKETYNLKLTSIRFHPIRYIKGRGMHPMTLDEPYPARFGIDSALQSFDALIS